VLNVKTKSVYACAVRPGQGRTAQGGPAGDAAVFINYETKPGLAIWRACLIVIFELTECAIQLIKTAIDMPERRVLLKKRQFILKLHYMFLHGISVKNAL
jgi:hypothetical protein